MTIKGLYECLSTNFIFSGAAGIEIYTLSNEENKTNVELNPPGSCKYMITVKELYDWAVENNCENKELITVHSYDFDEDPGDQKIEKIAGINVYIELAKE